MENQLLYSIIYLCTTTTIIFFVPSIHAPVIRILSLICSSGYLMLVLCLLKQFDNCYIDFQYQWDFELIPEYNINLSLGIDGISLSFLILTAFIFPLCILSAEVVSFQYKQFILYLLFIEIFLSLSFSVTNLFIFYVFFESVLIPMFLIIGIWGARARKINAAYYFFLYTLFGSFFLLFGILYLYTLNQSLNYKLLTNIIFSRQEQIMLWLFFFIPFAAKVPIFPFHIWLPEAHVEAPTIGSVILASLLLKLGGYGLLRFTVPMFPQGSFYFMVLITILSLLSVIYASLVTIRQNDLKRIIAYSSVAHMNLIVLGLFSFTHQGLDGAIYLMICHGIVSSGLFFCIGILYDRYHTRSLKQYSGLVQVMPLYAIFFFIFTLANMGFPGTANFPGELLILTGVFEHNVFNNILAATSVVLSAIYSIWSYNRTIFGTLKASWDATLDYADLNRAEFYILLPLCITVIVLGVNSTLVTTLTCIDVKKILLTTIFKL